MHRLILALILLQWTVFSHATDVSNLNRATIAVATQSEADRAAAAPELLRQVVLKIVGDSEALQQVDLESLTANAERFIQRYHYSRSTPSPMSDEAEQLLLTLTFDQNSLLEAINQAGLPQWGQQRPDVLIWVALDDGQQREMLSDMRDAHGIIQRMRDTGRERALPLVFPVMDLEDQMQLTFSDVWNGDAEATKAASARYGTAVVAIARVQLRDDDAEISWQAFLNEETLRWQSAGQTPAALYRGIGELTDQLARRMGQVVSSGPSQTVQILVSDVRDFSDYNRLLAYLNRLPAVSAVDVINLSDNQLELRLSVQGQPAALQQTLGYGQVLRAESSTAEQQRYRLLP